MQFVLPGGQDDPDKHFRFTEVIILNYHLFSSEGDKKIEELSQEISPMMSEFSSDIYLNDSLFDRIEEIKTS